MVVRDWINSIADLARPISLCGLAADYGGDGEAHPGEAQGVAASGLLAGPRRGVHQAEVRTL